MWRKKTEIDRFISSVRIQLLWPFQYIGRFGRKQTPIIKSKDQHTELISKNTEKYSTITVKAFLSTGLHEEMVFSIGRFPPLSTLNILKTF